MSLTTVAASLPELPKPALPFAKVEVDFDVLGGSFDQMRKAGQRLSLFLWIKVTNLGQEEVIITLEEMADGCGRSIRWASKAIRQLLGHGQLLGQDKDDQSPPKIASRYIKGPRHACGRAIKFIIPFAGPKKEEESEGGAKGKGKGKGKPESKATATAPTTTQAAEPEEPAGPGVWAQFKGTVLGKTAVAPKSDADIQRRKAELDAQLEALARRRKATPGPDPEAPAPHRRE